jgi:hypothetical protein
MPYPRAVYDAIEDLFGCEVLVDVIYSEPVTQIRAEVGIIGGKVWQVEIDVDGNDPVVPEPRLTAARPSGLLEFTPPGEGEPAPERVTRHAARMVEALRAAEHSFRDAEPPAPGR